MNNFYDNLNVTKKLYQRTFWNNTEIKLSYLEGVNSIILIPNYYAGSLYNIMILY